MVDGEMKYNFGHFLKIVKYRRGVRKLGQRYSGLKYELRLVDHKRLKAIRKELGWVPLTSAISTFREWETGLNTFQRQIVAIQWARRPRKKPDSSFPMAKWRTK
jgi:hypothetical protein